MLKIENLVLITDYIILFPIKWYSIVNRVIAKSTIYNNVIIVNKSLINNYKDSFFEIIEILNKCELLSEISENKDFYIYYFRDEININIFKKWINLISLRACLDTFSNVSYTNLFNKDFKIKVDDIYFYINPEKVHNDGINILLKKVFKDNVVVYNFNYFSFCESLNKTYHLLL